MHRLIARAGYCCILALLASQAAARKPGSGLHLEVTRANAAESLVSLRIRSDVAVSAVRIALDSSRGRRVVARPLLDRRGEANLDIFATAEDVAVVALAETATGGHLAAVATLRAEAPPAEPLLLGVTELGRHYRSVGPPVRHAEALAKAPRTTVQGVLTYQDALYDSNGLTGVLARKPIRRARVELIDANDGRVLAATHTDAAGKYKILFKGPAGTSLLLRVLSYSDLAAYQLQVFDTSANPHVYTVDSSVFLAARGRRVRVDLVAADAAANVFNVFDQGVRGFDFIRTLAAANPPRLTFFWRPGNPRGTFYRPTEDAIHLLGLASDSDGFDDDVILHEIGHFYLARFSRDDSPGGGHSPFDQVDARLAWSEGFANYFSSAVRNQSGYVDTFAVGRFFVNWETGDPVMVGPANEGAVAMALWDLHDEVGPGEPFDALLRRDGDVARINQQVLVGQPDVDVLSFCPAWAALGLRDYPQLQTLMGERSIPCP